jgi:hypothetical protein
MAAPLSALHTAAGAKLVAQIADIALSLIFSKIWWGYRG